LENLKKIFLIPTILFSTNIFGGSQLGKNLEIIEMNYEKGETFILKQGENDGSQLLKPIGIGMKNEKYYLIRSGVKVSPSSGSKGSLTFFGSLPENIKTCAVENIYDKSFTVGSNFLSTQDKRKILSSCTKFLVEDTQKGLIEFEPTQNNCHLERINDYSVSISTGDCFIKIKPDQFLNVKIDLNPNCNDRAFLSQNNLSPSEIQAEWSAYFYPEKEMGTIFVPIGEPIWKKNLFININPGNDLLKVNGIDSGENQTIYRPNIFVFPDFIFSNLEITQTSASSNATLSLLISTYGGKDFCNSGLCSAYGNYDFSFAPYFTLYEIDPKNNKKIELKSFFMGDRLPGKWNGTFSQNLSLKGILFEVGKKYSIELTFSDPASSYLELKRSFKSLLGLGRTSVGRIGRTGIGTISGFNEMPAFREEIGTLGNLNTGNFFETIAGIPEEHLPRIIETFNDPTFPPEYSTVCNKNMTVCKNANIKDQEKLSLTFEVKGIDQNNKLDFGGSMEVQRIGKFLPEYKTIVDLNKIPKINCGGIY
jgi:hypothetical protein